MDINRDIQIGDKMLATRDIYFCDDTLHKKGDIIVVTKDTLAYFQLRYFNYEKQS